MREETSLRTAASNLGSVTRAPAVHVRNWPSLGLIGFVVLTALACYPAVKTVQRIRAGEVCSQRGGESLTEDAGLVGPVPSVRCETTWLSGTFVVDRQQVWVPFVPIVAVLAAGAAVGGRRRRPNSL